MPDKIKPGEQLNATIEEWKPTDPETDKDFFEKVVPQLQAIKGRHLRDLATRRPGFSEESIQKSLGYLEKRLRALKSGDTVPMARAGGSIIGYILVRWDDGENREQIEQFCVDIPYRDRGVGTKLLVRAMERARNARPGESEGIFLTTGEMNEGAQRLYGRWGFHQSDIPADDEGEVRLELDFEAR